MLAQVQAQVQAQQLQSSQLAGGLGRVNSAPPQGMPMQQQGMPGLSRHPSAGLLATAGGGVTTNLSKLQSDLEKQGGFHKWLMDMLPQPIFVRTATGAVLYANRATADAVGVLPGRHIERWQLTPRAVPRAGLMGLGNQGSQIAEMVEGERDLPRAAIAGSPHVLPAPSESHSVLLQDAAGAQRSLLSMHRIPFWMADSGGLHHAVVMYIGC